MESEEELIERSQRYLLRAGGLAGATVFAVFFALTFSVPQWLEHFASGFIEARTTERIDATIDALRPPHGDSALARVAADLYTKNTAEIERLKLSLKSGIHEKMAAALVEIRNLDCECRQILQRVFEQGTELQLSALSMANERLVDFIHATYMKVFDELRRDVRIFTVSNAIAFLLLVLLSFLKPHAVRHLFLPGVLLAVSTILCAYLYVFEQNWLLTIIYADYLGFAYSAYLGAVFLFFCDIVFNRGRVTTRLVNTVLEGLGSAFSLVPC